MRVELPGGGWADLRERLLYGQARDVRVGLVESQRDPAALVDFDLVLVRAYVEAWSVVDPDGHAVPLESPELAPDEDVQAIVQAAMGLWNGRPDPKGTPGRSPTRRRARP